MPDVPANVIADVDAAVVSAAVRVVFCAMPGVRFSVAGFAVTPDGRPLIATVTAPVNEFSAAAVRLTCEPPAPAIRVSVAGDALSVKSDRGATVTATPAEWLNAPDVPVKVTVKVPAPALVAAVKATLCAVPGVRFNVAGFAVTPAGRPVIATATVPTNELTAAAVTLTCEPVAPGTIVNDVGDTASEKSGGGGGTEMVAVTVEE